MAAHEAVALVDDVEDAEGVVEARALGLGLEDLVDEVVAALGRLAVDVELGADLAQLLDGHLAQVADVQVVALARGLELGDLVLLGHRQAAGLGSTARPSIAARALVGTVRHGVGHTPGGWSPAPARDRRGTMSRAKGRDVARNWCAVARPVGTHGAYRAVRARRQRSCRCAATTRSGQHADPRAVTVAERDALAWRLALGAADTIARQATMCHGFRRWRAPRRCSGAPVAEPTVTACATWQGRGRPRAGEARGVGQRLGADRRRARGQPLAIAARASSQSFLKRTIPRSVSGWWTICWRTLNGSVRDVRAGQRRVGDVARAADRRREHLRVQVVEVDDLGELADDDHPLLVRVVDPAHERRQQRRARLGGEQALVRREDQRAVGLDALGPEALDRLEAVLRHRDLDHDVVRELREVPALGEHAVDVVRDDLGRHGPRREGADLLEDLVVRLPLDPRVQRRVRRHAVDDAPPDAGPDLFDVGGVEEQLHG